MKEQKNSHLVILGSSRSDGNTREALEHVRLEHQFDLVDLSELEISYFDYAQQNFNDDFIPLAEKMLEYDSIILATPVYWYSMSALMKTFIDRWSDFLITRKDIGRGLVGKKLSLVCSYGSSFPERFENPFRLTCEYLGMHYTGCYYHYCGKNKEQIHKSLLSAKTFQQYLG